MKYFAALTILLGTVAHSAPWQVSTIRIRDLGTLGGTGSAANDINESGNIVGFSTTPQGKIHAFLYSNDTMVDLIPGLDGWSMSANGINDANVIVGDLHGADIDVAYRLANGVIVVLPSDISSTQDIVGSAAAINNAGQVVGFSSVTLNIEEACIWQANDARTLLEPDPLGTSWGQDINASGVAVGFSIELMTGARWVWSPTAPLQRTAIPTPPSTLFLSYTRTDGRGINNQGAIVGSVGADTIVGPVERPFYWNGTSAKSQALPLIATDTGGTAMDINDGGFIVGASWPQSHQAPIHAFLYHPDFGTQQLPGLPGAPQNAFCSATRLNERKSTGVIQIVGYCTNSSGANHAVLWEVKVIQPRMQ